MSGLTRTKRALLVVTFLTVTAGSAQEVRSADDVESGLAGLWFDSDRDGEGFNVIESAAGTTIYYYGYDDDGRQLWLVSETLAGTLAPGVSATLSAVVGDGGTFDAPANGSRLPGWGTISVTVEDCSRAVFELDGRDGFKRSETRQLALIDGNECRLSAPSAIGTGYCEVQLLYPREDGLVRAEVWSSRPVGGCPQELWQALDAEAIQAASGAAAVGLDGPRQDLLDANRLRPFGGEIRAFGGIAMAQVSTRELNPRELSGGNDYIELSEQRTARGALRAGRQVYELVSDRNLAFVMTSISQRVDPDLSVEELASLGERLALPHGWIWRTRTLEEDLELEAEAKATIVFDEFGNAYERLDYAGAYRVAGLWYDEARNGEGFNVIQSEAGTTVYFYGYDAAGEPLWLVSDTITAALRPGQVVELTAYRGAGGTFEAPVPGAELDVWGTIRMVPLDCNEIAFELTGADGAKLSDAVKLAGITGNQCSESIPAGDYGFALIHDGLLRNYDLHVPPGYDGTPLPLVVDLHGLGGSVGGQRRRNLGLADEEGFLLAVPAGTGLIPSWNAGNCCQPAQDNDVDDVGFVLAVVNDISARTPVDEKRIYATGTSNGGALSHLLACRAADVFAAIAPTAFVLPVDDCQPSRPITVAHFHGLDDTTVPYDGGPSRGGSVVRIGAVESHETWAALNACPNPPTRVLEINDTYCDAYESCAGGVINVLCSVDAGHSLGMNTDLDVARAAWGLISPFSLP